MGVQPMSGITDAQKAELGVTGDHGAVVASVTPGGPADRAGLRPGDLLLRFAGKEAPDLTLKEREAHHLWYVAIHLLLEHVWAGQAVPVEFERDGKTRSARIVPITAAEMHALQADPASERAGPLPAIATAGAAEAFTLDFETAPAGLHPWEGLWTVEAESGSAGNHVLKQGRTTQPWAVMLFAGRGRAYRDGRITVRFRPVSGVEDASGGIVFRARDALNYYVVRANADEDNYRLYIVQDGVRTELASTTVPPPRKGTWHTMEVEFTGEHLRATFDGEYPVEAQDARFDSGWCGLWTKADSVTLFDDYAAQPAGEAR